MSLEFIVENHSLLKCHKVVSDFGLGLVKDERFVTA